MAGGAAVGVWGSTARIEDCVFEANGGPLDDGVLQYAGGLLVRGYLALMRSGPTFSSHSLP